MTVAAKITVRTVLLWTFIALTISGLILAIVQAVLLQFGLWFWLGALSFLFFYARVDRAERKLRLLEIERRYELPPSCHAGDKTPRGEAG